MNILSRIFGLCRRRSSSAPRVVESVTVGGITATVVEVDDVFDAEEWPRVPEVGDFVTAKLLGKDEPRQGWVSEVLSDGPFSIVINPPEREEG